MLFFFFSAQYMPIWTDANCQQEVNIQNMNVELVAQMFKNYQSNVLFHLEGMSRVYLLPRLLANLNSHGESEGAVIMPGLALYV